MKLEMLLHGEQSVELLRPLPSSAKVKITARVSEVWDKGKAAVIGVESTGSDEKGPLFKTHATLFVRGAGGFGGERGPASVDSTPPERTPDAVVEDMTRPEQGAIYRLSGDRNPIHIDPDFAIIARNLGAQNLLLGFCCWNNFGACEIPRLPISGKQ